MKKVSDVKSYEELSINLAQRLADSIIDRNMDYTDKWRYEYGLVLKGIEEVYLKTKDKKYLDFIKKNIDAFVKENGTIRNYSIDEYNIDHINNGKNLFFLYRETGEEKYKLAMDILRTQLKTHPRTKDGAFWHKNVYPNQVWLDGIFMGDVFYSEYVKEYGSLEEFDDVTNQFLLCEKYTKDKITGLLYHAYDDTKSMYWCDAETGKSKHFWCRAIGWYLNAIVDMLDYLPKAHKDRDRIIEILNEVVDALLKYKDKESNVWYQIVDQGDRKGNYLEASGSSMIVYAMAKGVRCGYLPKEYKEEVLKSYRGCVDEFILETKEGFINVNKICYVAGLGGNDRRDGSFTYYISEPILCNEPKGVGAFLLAAAEVEKLK